MTKTFIKIRLNIRNILHFPPILNSIMAAEVRTSFRAILRHVKRLPTIGSPAHGHRSFIINKVRRMWIVCYDYWTKMNVKFYIVYYAIVS